MKAVYKPLVEYVNKTLAHFGSHEWRLSIYEVRYNNTLNFYCHICGADIRFFDAKRIGYNYNFGVYGASCKE